MSDVREIVVISGKGGTGKTTVAAGFADLAEECALADCDVDAANLELLMNPSRLESHEFIASSKAVIDPSLCIDCGLCRERCRFHAIADRTVDPFACEGCGLCARICPVGAIRMEPVLSGHWFISDTEKGPMVHARLVPGEENSGRLVTLVRQKARNLAEEKGRRLLVTDGPPGIGCPVVASITGAQLAVAVTEPSVSGIHDLERVVEVCRRFDVPVLAIVNKWDIHKKSTEDITELCGKQGIKIVGRIPYDDGVYKAMADGVPVTRHDTPASLAIKSAWQEVLQDPLADKEG